MSGTLGYMQRESAELAATANTLAALAENRNAAQNLLIDMVKTAAGWSQIDPEFQAVIDASLSSQMVDLDALAAQITAWKAIHRPNSEV